MKVIGYSNNMILLCKGGLDSAKRAKAQWSKIRAYHGIFSLYHLFCLTFHHSRGTFGARAWCTSGALGGLRAFHLWAARAWAWRAFSLRLMTLGAVQNHRILLRNGGFKDIIA